eukprot:475082-Alexandrium_andersonii.AAC.1
MQSPAVPTTATGTLFFFPATNRFHQRLVSGDPRTKASRNDGFAITAAGAIAMVLVAVLGT